jgi:hypothetical protein
MSDPVPTDAQMIERFYLYESDFEKLCDWVDQDKIKHFPLTERDIRYGDVLTISDERAKEYSDLMKKISITDLWYVNESVTLDYFANGDATWGVYKSYECYPKGFANYERNSDCRYDIENDLLDEAKKYARKNSCLYKRINDRWDIFLLYDW